MTLRNITLLLVFWAGAAVGATSLTSQSVFTGLSQAFEAKTGRAPRIVRSSKTFVDVTVETVQLVTSARTYRVVFSGGPEVRVTTQEAGDVAAQLLVSVSSATGSTEEIVSVIFQKEFGEVPTAFSTPPPSGPAADTEGKIVRKPPPKYDLRWDRLIGRVMSGEGALSPKAPSGGDGGFDQAVALSRALSPCQTSGGASPHREAVSDITQALAALPPAVGKTGLAGEDARAEKSRDYSKVTAASFLRELGRFQKEAQPEQARIYLEEGRKLLWSILGRADLSPGSTDFYAVAASGNLRRLLKDKTRPQAKTAIDRALSKSSVGVEEFLRLRFIVPNASIIYDRQTDQFYFDPTINSPWEAAYEISVALIYDHKAQSSDVDQVVRDYRAAISRLEILRDSPSDETNRKEKERLAIQIADLERRLWDMADRFRRDVVLPRK